RGGVHFLLQVDMRGALTSRYDSIATDVRNVLRQARIPLSGVERADQSIVASFDSEEARDNASSELRRAMPDMELTPGTASGGQYYLTGRLTEAAVTQGQVNARRQTMTTLHNRINELGDAEPRAGDRRVG